MGDIYLKHVSKTFNGKTIIDDISLRITKNTFNVILGENGSGKSTLFKIMTGLLIPDKGEVYYGSERLYTNYKKNQYKMGVVLADERTLYHKLTAYENLFYVGRIFGVEKKELKKRIDFLMKELKIENDTKLIENYSTGMKKKVMVARALLHSPKYIFCDEILNGLDEDTKKIVLKLLNDQLGKGATIVMITHIIEEFPYGTKIYRMKNGSISEENNDKLFFT